MGPTDAFWRIFASTGGVGAYLLYRTCIETPPGQHDLLTAQTELAKWELAEEWGIAKLRPTPSRDGHTDGHEPGVAHGRRSHVHGERRDG